MTRKVWLALSLVAAAFLLFTVGPKAKAWTQFKSGNNATVAAGETVDSSLWIGAKNIDIAGTVNGDVICGAQTVNISGTVKGDVICGAQTITLSGSVEGSARLGAQTINLNGSIGRSAIMAAQTINTDSRSQIAGDASLAASDMNLNGVIGRDLSAAGSNVNLSGTVGRDIKSSADKIVLAGGAKVGGSIDYTSKNTISQLGGSQVGGNIDQHFPKAKSHPFFRLIVFGGVFGLVVALILIASALLVTALFPQFVQRVSDQGAKRPWRSLLTGLVASIVVPILLVLLMVTVVGIPVAILLLLSWLLINFSSGLFTSYLVGRRIWNSQHNALAIVLAGSLALMILYFIPIVGIIGLVLATWLGEGMLLLELKAHIPKPKYQVK